MLTRNYAEPTPRPIRSYTITLTPEATRALADHLAAFSFKGMQGGDELQQLKHALRNEGHLTGFGLSNVITPMEERRDG